MSGDDERERLGDSDAAQNAVESKSLCVKVEIASSPAKQFRPCGRRKRRRGVFRLQHGSGDLQIGGGERGKPGLEVFGQDQRLSAVLAALSSPVFSSR